MCGGPFERFLFWTACNMLVWLFLFLIKLIFYALNATKQQQQQQPKVMRCRYMGLFGHFLCIRSEDSYSAKLLAYVVLTEHSVYHLVCIFGDKNWAREYSHTMVLISFNAPLIDSFFFKWSNKINSKTHVNANIKSFKHLRYY